ncbi:MAG: hypothetical protein ACYCT9_04575 [Leptospirillum sp.]
MTPMTLEDFIKNTIIDELGIMVNTPGLKYLSFGAMSSAIEFLGACLDTEDFHKPKQSERRFKKAINELNSFGRYRGSIGPGSGIDLYAELRSGMIHALLPQSRVELTERADPNGGGKHLKELNLKDRSTNPRLLLVCEDLYDDISTAAIEVIQELKSGNYFHKVDKAFMATEIEISGTP